MPHSVCGNTFAAFLFTANPSVDHSHTLKPSLRSGDQARTEKCGPDLVHAWKCENRSHLDQQCCYTGSVPSVPSLGEGSEGIISFFPFHHSIQLTKSHTYAHTFRSMCDWRSRLPSLQI